MELAHKTDRLLAAWDKCFSAKREVYLRSAAKLDAMSPLKVLSRGYAFAQDDSGTIVTDAGSLRKGERLNLTLYRGKVRVCVEETEPEGEKNGETRHE